MASSTTYTARGATASSRCDSRPMTAAAMAKTATAATTTSTITTTFTAGEGTPGASAAALDGGPGLRAETR